MKMKKTSQQIGQDTKTATRTMWERRQARWTTFKKEIKMTTKKITKAQFGWIVEIIRAGEIVRRFECATMEEARRCE